MAVKFTELESQCRQIINDVKNGNFAPVYLLMGTEPYYPDLVCDEIIKYALTDSERDFNQTVFYGLDTDAGTVASECRSYPMMAERRLVVVKEAQSMKTLEDLAAYASDPMESTVLVILMHGASADKRRALYKNVQKKGVVLVSDALRDYEMPQWITSFYKSRGLDIEPAAAALLAEYAGTDMSRIMLETEKMQKNLPEGTVRVNAADIEKNVGISRQFSIFELTKALSYMKAEKALKITDELLCAGLVLDREFIYFSSLLHDIARSEPGHADIGAKWLSELGYISVAGIIRQHHDIEFSGINEAAVVYIADKCVRDACDVTLEKRFSGSLAKCTSPGALEAHKRRYDSALKIKNEINRICGKEAVV